MKQDGWLASGTFNGHPKPGLIHCDLTDSNSLKKLDVSRYRYGVVLSAVANIDQCKRDPKAAARVNVDGTKRLVDTLEESDVRPVFFSTDYVYSGPKGNYSETAPPSPNTEYGRQKAAMESYIQATSPQALVVRISKIFSADPTDDTLLSEWYRQVQRKETIRCIANQRTCPTYDRDLTEAVLQLLERGATGLLNVCQPKSYSRAELLAEFLAALDIRYEQIVEVEARELGLLDERPGDVSLNPAKFLDMTGFRFTVMEEVFERFRENAKRSVP